MKQLFVLPLTIALAGIPALAANCATGTLKSYIKLGAAGCQLGNLHVGSFKYAPSATTAPGVSPDQITVTPLLVQVGTVALEFAAPWQVTTGESRISKISYQITGIASTPPPTTISEVRLTADGFKGGLITNAIVSETIGASAVTSNLQVYEKCAGSAAVCNTKTSAMENLPKPVSSLLVADTITLNSKSGATSLTDFTDWFVTCIPCVF